MKKFRLLLFFACVIFLHSSAQAGTHFNNDSIDCVSKNKLYLDFLNQGNFEQALNNWRYVFKNCPGHSKRIYIDGVSIFEKKIAQEKNSKLKSELSDTLFMIYDQRIKYFGEEGLVTGRKGISLYHAYPDKKNEINLLLKKSVELESSKSTDEVLDNYFQVNKELFTDKKITRENLIDLFHTISLLIDTNRTQPDSAKYNKTQLKMDAYVSTIVNCKDLVDIYSQDIKDNPEDVNLLRKIVHLYNLKECYDEDTYLEAAQALYRIQPTAPSAIGLAKYYIAKDQTAKAGNYFNEAFDLESDINKKADLLIEISRIYLTNFKNYSQAKTYALRAASLKPGWGYPYMMIGDIYVAYSNNCEDEFEGASAYWAAADKYEKARSTDPSFADQADKKNSAAFKHFPAKEKIIQTGMKEGDTYLIKCWINESTTIRSKK